MFPLFGKHLLLGGIQVLVLYLNPRRLQLSKLHSGTVKHVGKSKGVFWGFSFGYNRLWAG